jgi:hypothetical protein
MSKIATNEQAGHKGELYVGSGTTAFTAVDHNGGEPWSLLVVYEDTVFTTLTNLKLHASSTTKEGVTIKAGVYPGQYTAATRSSGSFSLYD